MQLSVFNLKPSVLPYLCDNTDSLHWRTENPDEITKGQRLSRLAALIISNLFSGRLAVGFSKTEIFPTIRLSTAACDLLSDMMGGYRNYQIRYEFQLQFLEFGVICMDAQEVTVGFRDIIFQHRSRKKKEVQKKKCLVSTAH
jgi:hypothetical protein